MEFPEFIGMHAKQEFLGRKAMRVEDYYRFEAGIYWAKARVFKEGIPDIFEFYKHKYFVSEKLFWLSVEEIRTLAANGYLVSIVNKDDMNIIFNRSF